MPGQTDSYQSTPFPADRKVIVDGLRYGSRRHLVYGLVELDVTRPRELIRQHKAQTGESLSFTAYIVTCFAQAVAANPSVQAYRNWRNQLILFNDVDVVTMIETEVGGVALPHIVRGANGKTFRQVHDEVRAVQAGPQSSPQTGGLIALGSRMPRFIRDLFYGFIRHNPHQFKQIGGTVIVTAVGMFGHGSGWGLGVLPYHTLGLLIGGIGQKPGVVDGRIEVRDYLSLTITFDHDIVDGAPAARFAQRLKELIESGEVLNLRE